MIGNTRVSLLRRVSSGDAEAWNNLVLLYQPLIRVWLLRAGVHFQDAEDLIQDVLAIMVKELSRFEHAGRIGSFRNWLRTVTVNRAREFWRAHKNHAPATGGLTDILDQLADPRSTLTSQWDEEHDGLVVHRLLTLLDEEFEPQTAQAFRRLMFDRHSSTEVAADLQMTVSAVYSAKARVLRRFREEAEGLLE